MLEHRPYIRSDVKRDLHDARAVSLALSAAIRRHKRRRAEAVERAIRSLR